MRYNTTGYNNTASGYQALYKNTTGYSNTATGSSALYSNTTGHSNTASGQQALNLNTTGYSNAATGRYALNNNTTGTYNIGIGYNANSTSATVSGQCTLGDANISNLRCNDTTISSLSDQRDKTEITDVPNEMGLNLINKLRPVTFYWDRREWYDNGTPDGSKIKRNYNNQVANSGQRHGFIAQEVLESINGIKSLEDSQVVTTDNPDKLEFAPAHLITPLVKAVQELAAQNDTLLARIETLENS